MICTHAEGLSKSECGILEGKKYCYECCAELDRQHMLKNDKIALYLTPKGITNWSGTLKFEILDKKHGSHNMAGTRIDVWFVGPDKHIWWGVQYGENTELLHCKRTKQIWS